MSTDPDLVRLQQELAEAQATIARLTADRLSHAGMDASVLAGFEAGLATRSVHDAFINDVGPGWAPLLRPLLERIEALGGTVHQVKEKYGALRLYYQLPVSVPRHDAYYLEQAVDRAEILSEVTCEDCGKVGSLRTNRYWTKTLCANCATTQEAKRWQPLRNLLKEILDHSPLTDDPAHDTIELHVSRAQIQRARAWLAYEKPE